MDRFTWGFVIGAVLLCVVAAGTIFIARATPPPSLSTPAGVVTAYLQAVRDRDADRAWDLLAPGAAIGGPVPPPAASGATSRDTFRRELADLSGRSSANRIRIINTTEKRDTARVDIEVTSAGGGVALFGGDDSRTLTFSLKRVDGGWKIDTGPSLYEIG